MMEESHPRQVYVDEDGKEVSMLVSVHTPGEELSISEPSADSFAEEFAPQDLEVDGNNSEGQERGNNDVNPPLSPHGSGSELSQETPRI